MSKYIFIKKPDENNQYDISTVTFEFQTVDKSDLIENFEDFLKACGYVIKGYITEVEE
jgi:hypothetical protein